MALVDRDVGIAVAATAAVLSPRTREVLRRGAVYGLAGVMKAGDVMFSTAKGAAHGVQEGISGDGSQTSSRAQRPRSKTSSGSRSRQRSGRSSRARSGAST